MQTLKTPMRKHERASDDSAVAKVVDEIVSAVATDGDAAVARYSASLDGWEPQRFRLTPDAIAASLERVPTQVLDDIVVLPGAGAGVRAGAAGDDGRPRGGDPSRCPARPSAPARGERRRLRPRRPLPDGRLRAHEHRHREGRRRRACRGLHSASRRADPGRHRRRDAPRRRRRDLHPRRRPGDRRDGARDGVDRPGGLPRRPGQRVRRRGQAPAVRQGRHRPHRRPDGDPDRRRRDRRPGDRRRRPARPGRARARLAGRPRHDVAGTRRGDAAPGRGAARGPGDRGHRGPGVGGLRRDRRRRLGPGGARARRRVRLRARRDPDRESALVPRADAQLRRPVSRRGDDRRVRRQDDRHEPHPPDARRGALHGRPVGREVPQDRDLPGVRRGGERDDRRDLRPPVPDRELRGSRAQLRRPRRQVPQRRARREETA